MDIATILIRKYFGTEWSLNGSAYDGLIWLSDGEPPTEAELEALWPEVEYNISCELVEMARQAAYKETADPMFFEWQAGSATKEEWEAERQRIKDAHPYPEAP
jgi:hypothetical protein